jgi:hypothetical protein
MKTINFLDIGNYTKNLTEENGIFFSKNRREVSYPKGGNEHCFQSKPTVFGLNTGTIVSYLL